MNFTRLLNQVLSTVQKKGGTFSDSPLNSFGGGALVAGIASMLLNGKNRKTITKIGSTAALGYLAYRGYSDVAAKQRAGNCNTKRFPTCRRN